MHFGHGPAGRPSPSQARIARAIQALRAVTVTLAWLLAPSAGLARSSGSVGPVPACAAEAVSSCLGPLQPICVTSLCTGALPSPDLKPSRERRAAGAPFVTQAHAIARGDYPLPCAQLSKVVLRTVHLPSLRRRAGCAPSSCDRRPRISTRGGVAASPVPGSSGFASTTTTIALA